MQLSDNKEHGVKLDWQRTSAIAGIPLKKRPLIWARSPSPPSQSSSSPTTECNHIKLEPLTSPTNCSQAQCETCSDPGSSTSGLSCQKPLSETPDVMVSSCQGKGEPSGDGSPHLDNSYGFPFQESIPIVDAPPGLDTVTCIKPTLDKIIASQIAAREMELKSTICPVLEVTRERTPSNKSAFQRVSGGTELSLKSSVTESHNNRESVMQENFNSACGGTMMTNEAPDALRRTPEAEMGAKRLDWDLNTMMHTWGESSSAEDKNFSEGGHHASDLGARHNKEHEICHHLMVTGERHSAGILPEYTENDKFLTSPESATPPNMHLRSYPHINLQLGTASGTQSYFNQAMISTAKMNTGGTLSELSLSLNSSLVTRKPKMVKSEPYEIYDQRSTTQAQSNPKVAPQKFVKSEPSDESSLKYYPEFGSNNMETLSPFGVKPDTSKEHVNGSMFESENTKFDGLVLQSPAYAKILCDLQLKVPCSTNSPKMESKSSSSHHSEPGRDPVNDTSLCPSTSTVCKSTMVKIDEVDPFKTTITQREYIASHGAVEVKDANLDLLSKTVGGGEMMLAGSVSNNSVQIPFSDQLVSEELEFESVSFMMKEVDRSGIEEKSDMSTQSPEQKPLKNDDLDCGKQTTLREHSHDDDMEDGEVRDLQQHDSEEGLAAKVKPNHAHMNVMSGSVAHEHSPMATTSPLDGKEIGMQQHLKDKEGNSFSEFTDKQCNEETGLNGTNDLKESTMLTSEAIEKISITIKTSSDSDSTVINGQDETTGCSPKVSNMLPESDSAPSKLDAILNSADTENLGNRIGLSNAAQSDSLLNNSSSGRAPYAPRKLMSSRIEKESSSYNSLGLKEEKPQGPRSRSYRHFSGYQKERNRDGPSRKFEHDFPLTRGRFDHKSDVHGGRNYNPHYGSEHTNNTASFRYTRPKIVSEASFATESDGSVDSVGWAARNSGNNKFENFSHQPSRRWSPRHRGQMPVDQQMVYRPMRGISTGRRIDDGDADVILLDSEEKFARDLSNDMIDPSMLSGPHSTYDRGENYIQRGRRSISPDQRRGPPYLSIRPRLHSPHMWSPRRLPDGFNGHPELVTCRSPRVERVGSPGGDGFPDDVPGRDFPRNIGPVRAFDYSRPPGRGFPRNLRRFHVMDSRVNSEEEYFGPLRSGHFNELAREDEVDEGRNYAERHGFVRSVSQRYSGGGENSRNFSYRIERGPPRPIGYQAEGDEEFPERSHSRDRCIRNRLGDLPQRMRGMEEQEDTRHIDEMQGWHGSSFNQNRLKRRRF